MVSQCLQQRGQADRCQETLLEIAEDDAIEGGGRDVPSLADALTLLLASGAAIVRVGFPAAVGSRPGHAGATRSADGNAGQQGWSVHDPRRRGPRIVLSQFCLRPLENVRLDQSWDRDFNDGRRIVLTAIAGIALAVGPQSRCVASIGQNLMNRSNAERRSAPR